MDCQACYPPNTDFLPPSLARLLRLEALAVVLLSVVLYEHLHANWWLFAALWLLPDLSMIGYLLGPRWGAYSYNMVHSYVAPILVAAAALLGHRLLLPYVLIWINHIAVDRLLGYGLKSTTAFAQTHLKNLGRWSKA